MEHYSITTDRFINIQHIDDCPDGPVVIVFDKHTSKIYTLKRMDFSFVSAQVTEKFRAEVSALTALKNDSIVKLYMVSILYFSASKVIYRMIMEPIDHSLHGLLYRKMRPGNRLTLGAVRRILKSVLQGIDFCHKSGFVHLDLAPKNIFLLGSQNRAKLGGFGYCRERNFAIPVTHCSFGTLQYRAPESFLASEYVSSATDMWSVGLIFAEMCLGFPLLDGSTEIDIQRQIIELIGQPSTDQIKSGQEFLIASFLDAFPWQLTNHLEVKYPELRKLGAPGLYLLKAMLKRNRADRISAEMALKSVFFSNWKSGIMSRPPYSNCLLYKCNYL